MVWKQKQPAKVFVDITYKYDVYAQGLNEIVLQNENNKLIVNKSWIHINNS